METTNELSLPTQRRPRSVSTRRFVMCPPVHFKVVYQINAWMDVTNPVDQGRALSEWQAIHEAYLAAGHVVELLDPLEAAPDMVFAANGAVTIGDRSLLARFRHPERAMEEAPHAELLRLLGKDVKQSSHVSEGEGDFLVGSREVFAGWGFRCSKDAHDELAEVLGVEVFPLHLVDERFYHLDTAMLVLDDTTAAVYAPAFDEDSLQRLRSRFHNLVEVDEEEALAFGLNGVTDGLHVFMPTGAPLLEADLRALGFLPVPLDCTELLKAGGAVKCTTAEIWAPLSTHGEVR